VFYLTYGRRCFFEVINEFLINYYLDKINLQKLINDECNEINTQQCGYNNVE
jgi:hypothetical protein